jgi:hypothetical protein
MKTYSVIIGARTVGRSARLRPAHDRLLRQITRQHFPTGFTILNARGGWWNPVRHRFEEEESREVRVLAASLGKVRVWADSLRRALQQKEVFIIELGRTYRLGPSP